MWRASKAASTAATTVVKRFPAKSLVRVRIRCVRGLPVFVTTVLRPFKQKMPGEATCLRFVKDTENAFSPKKGSAKAAGFDLRSAYNEEVPARGKLLVKTDLRLELPEGCYGRVAPRSGLALKNHIDVGAGVIDEDYRGPVGVVLFNHSDVPFKVEKGDRIAQLICQKICYPKLLEVKSLDNTERGAGGFGSTGVN